MELARALTDGSGLVVFKGAFPHLDVVDRATDAFNRFIDAQNAAGITGGDHFAKPGANDRVWGALDKLALAEPAVFAEYYAADMLAVVAEAWLGPNYKVTSQVNVVNPGGTAQRDYHLTPALTLQGAVAHCDMPLESGPTLYLPHSHKYGPGFVAFHRDDFTEYFQQNYTQLRLEKGDAVFFNRRSSTAPNPTSRRTSSAWPTCCRSPRHSAGPWKPATASPWGLTGSGTVVGPKESVRVARFGCSWWAGGGRWTPGRLPGLWRSGWDFPRWHACLDGCEGIGIHDGGATIRCRVLERGSQLTWEPRSCRGAPPIRVRKSGSSRSPPRDTTRMVRSSSVTCERSWSTGRASCQRQTSLVPMRLPCPTSKSPERVMTDRQLSSEFATAQTALYVPGDKPERFAKACSSGAGFVIIDLEDAVAPGNKVAARNKALEFLGAGTHVSMPVLVRINASGTPWFEDDLRGVNDSLQGAPGAGLGIMLPKAEAPDTVLAVRRSLHDGLALVPLIESALGLVNALEIARIPGTTRLAFGGLDYAADLGVDFSSPSLDYARMKLAAVSRASGIHPPLDSPSVAISDTAQVEPEAVLANKIGLGGKLCIHPSQIPVVSKAFKPTDSEVALADKILGTAHEGASMVDGEMIAPPVLERARNIIKRPPHR